MNYRKMLTRTYFFKNSLGILCGSLILLSCEKGLKDAEPSSQANGTNAVTTEIVDLERQLVPIISPTIKPKPKLPSRDALGNVYATIADVPGDNIKGEQSFVLVKPSSKVYKGIFLIFFWGNGQDIFRNVAARRIAEENNIAILGVSRMMEYVQGGIGYAHAVNANTGGGDGIFNVINELATYTGHPELGKLPIAPFGHSRAGVMAASIAAWKPERVFAAIDYKPGAGEKKVTDIPVSNAFYNIPQLVIIGDKDGTGLNTTAIPFFQNARKANAPWAFIKQIRSGHSNKEGTIWSGGFYSRWITAIANLRISSNSLLGINLTNGYIGDNTTLNIVPYNNFNGSLENSSWLPTEDVAIRWKANASIVF